jgi:hypothetical protein
MEDAPDAAREEIEAAMRPWPREPFAYAHHGELLAVVFAELYRGGPGAMHWLDAEAARLERALLLRIPTYRPAYLTLRATARLAAWVDAPSSMSRGLLEKVHADTKALTRSRDPLAITQSVRLRVMLEMCAGRTEQALAQLEIYRTRLPPAHAWQRSACDVLGGILEGGERGREKTAATLDGARLRGWKNARRSMNFAWPIAEWYQAKRR